MPLKCFQKTTARRVPDAGRIVKAARRDLPAIVRPRRAVDRSFVPVQYANERAVFRTPDSRCSIFVRGEHALLIRRVCCGPHRFPDVSVLNDLNAGFGIPEPCRTIAAGSQYP